MRGLRLCSAGYERKQEETPRHYKERFRLFKQNRVEMLWLSPRVNYIGMEKKANERVPFQSGYICSGICSNQLEFDYMEIHRKGEGANG